MSLAILRRAGFAVVFLLTLHVAQASSLCVTGKMPVLLAVAQDKAPEKPPAVGPDETAYLRLSALQLDEKHDEAVAAADDFLKKHADSRWAPKARFAKAKSLLRLRRFAEAEAIYAAEATKLLSAERKHEIAAALVEFADALAAKPDPKDPGAPPPDYAKAYNLYKKVLEMEIDRALRDEVMFKAARTVQLAGNFGQAVADYHAYLQEFDPAWMGPVGSPQRMRGQKRENPPVAGRHVFESRYNLGETLIAAQQFVPARTEFEDLLSLLDKALPADDAAKAKTSGMVADTRRQIVRTYNMPQVVGDLEKAIKTARDFLEKHPNHPFAIETSWLIALTYQQHGRHDEAIAAYQDFIDGKNYKVAGDGSAKLDNYNKTAAELRDEWQQLALIQIGEIRFAQKQYDKAVESWTAYVNKYSSGPYWATAQQRIMDAQFTVALDAVAEKKYDDAGKLFDAFLNKYPLDGRARQLMFIRGQIPYAAAVKLEEEKGDRAKFMDHFRAAIAEWEKLVTKYPNTEESSLALYKIGLIQEERFGELEKALESYRRLTWGSWAPHARQRIAVMTEKQLKLNTERKFRTNETAQVKINTRNIQKLTVKQYFLDLEAYYRKTHSGTGVENLDIALIQPDKTWEVEIKDYAKFKPIEQTIDIPFEGEKPGVCIIALSEEDWEATTLVVRSDIDIVMRSSKRELLVYAQNMRENKPAEGVRILASDGQKVFATGETGKEGVFRKTFDELKDADTVHIFAVKERHVASNDVQLEGLELSTGLSRRGYIYTDRPAYQPGQVVRAKGIIREVKDGSYRVPAGADYIVTITDSSGRMLREEQVKLGELGTFDIAVPLDPLASSGQYTITAHEKDKPETDTGTFLVQPFQLEKMKLAFDFPRKVYYRGEKVTGTIKAEYYWGQPVADKLLRYVLPDGTTFTEKTDAKGELKFEFDTSGLIPGTVMRFAAVIEGEAVQARSTLFLPALGFDASVDVSQELVLAGEPFDVNVETKLPDNKPIGTAMTLTVLRLQEIKPDPVLSETPWVALPPQPPAYITISEQKLTTDEKTGKATVQLKLEKGGEYVLRVAGLDRFNQTVTQETVVTVSDDEDATKLRIFAENDTLKVGGSTKVSLHSRLKGDAIALYTFEGETIIAHRVVTIKAGHNALEMKLGHEHFPNFTLAATVMDGRELRSATHDFEVERELKVQVKPLAETYAPGAEGKVELTVTDQLGNPVKAELSLAMVNEALHAMFEDPVQPILEFFQEGAHRNSEFRVEATNGFSYGGATRRVVKAVQDEVARLQREEGEAQQLGALVESLKDDRKAKDMARLPLELPNPAFAGAPRPTPPGGSLQPASPKPASAELAKRALEDMSNDAILARNTRSLRGGSGGGGFGGGLAGERGRGLGRDGATDFEDMDEDTNGVADKLSVLESRQSFYGLAEGKSASSSPRRELPEDGYWKAVILTDDKGKAVVAVPMPQATTRWRLTAKGVTVETLVGEATGSVVTRKDFFVEIKTPRSAAEGDKLRVTGRVHNLTDFEGDVDVKLTVAAGDKKFQELQQSLHIKKKETVEVLFDPVEVPQVTGLDITVEAKNGELQDILTRPMAVRPWGMEYAAHRGGVATNDTAVTLELPKDLPYRSKWLSIQIGADLKQQVVDMALDDLVYPMPRVAGEAGVEVAGAESSMPQRLILPPVYGRVTGSELLAALGGLDYARSVNAPQADQQRLLERARSLVSALVVSQLKDGGWAWWSGVAPDHASDWAVTSVSYWALARAKQLGVEVNGPTLDAAEKLLQQRLAQLPGSDYDSKATILHALSVSNKADFNLLNPLHRQRNALTPAALAYTALALANLDRKPMAQEVVAVLETKLAEQQTDGRKIASWAGGSQHPWLTDRIETTAVALLAMMRVTPENPRIAQAAEYLLQQRGCGVWQPVKSRGPAVTAVAEYFKSGQFADADFKLAVTVNDKPLTTLDRKAQQPMALLAVPAEMLKDGANVVRFTLTGRGAFAYAATLRGFSEQFKDNEAMASPFVAERQYHHEQLSYRNAPIGVYSSSPVKNLPVGVHTRVTAYIGRKQVVEPPYLVIEEPLPAGATLVPGSLQGQFTHHEIRDGVIVMYYAPGRQASSYTYELVGYSPGTFRATPTVIRDAMDPSRYRIGKVGELNILPQGEKSPDPYAMNDSERFALGRLYFEDGLYQKALEHLTPLFDRKDKFAERDVARMLLWIHTTEKFYDAKRLVEAFEALSERHPDLVVPFDKILVAGKAYHDIGEFERASLVYRATIDSSFLRDSAVSAILQDEQQLLGSIDYQENLWWSYPDTPQVVGSHFALAQQLYQNAERAHELAKNPRRVTLRIPGHDPKAEVPKPTRAAMIAQAVRMMQRFLELYPTDPLADDAAFSLTNAYLDLKSYDVVVDLSGKYRAKYAKSDFASSFQYMTALGHFWKRDYEPALAAAKIVADGESKDRDFARYILGQVYHAQGKPVDSIKWYETVRDQYPDAKEAIDYFREKRISLEEVSTFLPGKPVEFELKHRNIADVSVQVYKVDLMKLYLREKNLSRIAAVNLAGIEPLAVRTIKLGDGQDYVDKKTTIKLEQLKDEGAYLVIVRGDDLFASGLSLITPLKLEVQEDAVAGRVRVNVLDDVKGLRPAGVHVKAIGSGENEFHSGETDLRGLFIADGLRGQTTVIARDADNRYAFYRGKTHLGAAPNQPPAPRNPQEAEKKEVDYRFNLGEQNRMIQLDNTKQWDQLRRSGGKGVQIQQAK